ncbi:MAG: NnrU family protein [Alphaproteobacteria bacterium]
MTGTIAELALAGLVLLATHYGIASTGLRGQLVAMLGEGPYRGLYSLIALAALVWLVIAYNQVRPGPVIWSFHPVGHFLLVVLMPLALVLVIGGLSQPNPMSAGMEERLRDPDPAVGVLRVTRHPVLWGIGLWAIGHIAANGDLASIVFFATLAILALFGTVLQDHRARRDRGGEFAAYELSTSAVPLLAIAQGRQNLGDAASEFGWVRLAVVAVAYGLLLHFHLWLFGMPAYPG